MKKSIASLLRMLATMLESETCTLTDDDLKPLRVILYESLDVYADYTTIAELKGKSVNAVRSESCRKGWKKRNNILKTSVRDALR